MYSIDWLLSVSLQYEDDSPFIERRVYKGAKRAERRKQKVYTKEALRKQHD